MKLSTIFNTVNTVRIEGIQVAINNLSDGYVDPQYFPVVETKHGDRFYRLFVNDIINVNDHYPSLEKVTKEDIVFDIGAFIGGFAIPAAKRAKMVYAFEPLYFTELNNNACLNHLTNFRPYPFALSDRGGMIEISYFKTEKVKALSFFQMKDITGVTPTYLKCNCEGAEWQLKPEDFAGIKTIEIQFHYAPKMQYNLELLAWLRKEYKCTEEVTAVKSESGIYQVRDVHGSKSNRI